ncbi:Rpn family recombination-promoting nuclease/putative transposase [Methylothermus subterraneus]
MKVPAGYDELYKRLFAHPEVMGELIEGFLPSGLAALCERESLVREEGSFVTPALSRRESDLIWSVALKGGCGRLYLYVLLEFQSNVDTAMPVRMLQYVAAFLQSLVEQNRLVEGKLPPVLPVVLYNGDVPWRAADSVAGMRVDGIPEAVLAYQPQLRFYLIDETRLPPEALDRDYLTALLFAIEQKGDFEQARVLMRKLARTLKAHYRESAALQRELTELMLVLFDKRFPGFGEQNDDIGDLDMLATRVEQWYQQALQKGREQGMEQGMQKGIQQGIAAERRLLLRLIRRRYGEGYAVKAQALLERIDDLERLAEIGEWIIEEDSGEAFLTRLETSIGE